MAAPTAGTELRQEVRRARVFPGARLRLLPSEGGWALVEASGQLVFSAPDLRGRRRCLQYARANGVLTLSS